MKFLDRILGRSDPEPDPAPLGDPQRIREVESVLDELRPLLAMDGGNVRLVAVVGDEVRLRFQGACSSCHVSDTTLRGAVEPRLRERLAWLISVRSL